LYADAGYLSNANVVAIRARGADPYIKPKKTSRSKPRQDGDTPGQRSHAAYYEMVEQFQTRPRDFLSHYGKRNTIESAWSGLKRRFGHAVGAFTALMRRTEAILKILVWNLTRVTCQ
jgi:IS5 family transposase